MKLEQEAVSPGGGSEQQSFSLAFVLSVNYFAVGLLPKSGNAGLTRPGTASLHRLLQAGPCQKTQHAAHAKWVI